LSKINDANIFTEGDLFRPRRLRRTFVRVLRAEYKYIRTCTCNNYHVFWYFADRASQHIYLNINQLDALNFIMSLFHASSCTSAHRQEVKIVLTVQFWPHDDEHLCSKHVEAW